MADASTPDSESAADHSPPIEDPLTPAERKRVQRLFAYGKERSADEQHDYAHEMFAQCVRKDPSNLIFVEALMDNLQAKFKNDKKGGKGRINRSAIKKAVAREAWMEVLDLGLDVLKENPWDVPSLRAMATACAALHFNEVELRYLKNALDANPKDLDVNRHCAESLARMGQFDQAIACWHRIEEQNRGDREAPKRISELTLAKAHHIGGIGMEDDEPAGTKSTKPQSASPSKSSSDENAPPAQPRLTSGNQAAESPTRRPEDAPDQTASKQADPATPEATREQQLQRAIADDPTNIAQYLELARILTVERKYKDAERTLMRALAASGNDQKVRQQLEQAQVRRRRHELAIAEQRAVRQPNDNNAVRSQVRQMRAELNRLELQIFSRRHEQNPDDLGIAFELGVRLKRAERFKEAAALLERAATDPRYRVAAKLERGECLQHARQYQAAMSCYREAISLAEAAGKSQLKWRKMALYRAAVLASGLKATEEARQLLVQLIQIDPSFRDAQSRLDKLSPG